MIVQIFSGTLGGLAYACSGLANAKKRESFDYKKMAPTLIIAAIVGGLSGYMGQDYGIVTNSSIAAGITVIIEKYYKAAYAKFKSF